MRAEPTTAEAAMWELLRADATGYRFRRQVTLWGFIVDFYCPALRIAIEVDGSAHRIPEIAARDEEKEKALERKRVSLLRFENEDVISWPRPVFMRIQEEVARKRLAFKGVDLGVDSKNLKVREKIVVVTVPSAKVDNFAKPVRKKQMTFAELREFDRKYCEWLSKMRAEKRFA